MTDFLRKLFRQPLFEGQNDQGSAPAVSEAGATLPAEPEAPVEDAAPVVEGEPEATSATPAAPPARLVPAQALDRVNAEKWEARRRAEAAEARARLAEEAVAAMREQQGLELPLARQQQYDPNDPNAPRYTEAQARDMARQEAAAISFNAKCNEIASAGRAAYPDFNVSLETLRSMSPAVDARGHPALSSDFLQVVIESPRAAEVLHALGKNAQEADRILSLPPARQAYALAQFESTLPKAATNGAARAVSNAPAPIAPRVAVSRGVEPSLYDDKVPIEDWMAKRQKEIDARRAAGEKVR